ncbi:MAG: sirohydrochlorin chelatase [Elusimicrobiota bacterium]
MISTAAAVGILLLAHGGDPAWNAQVENLRAAVSSSAPAALALGMADPDTLQAGVDALEKAGVSRIVAVPLFVNSNSEVMEQTRYSLGLSDKPSEVLREAAERMKTMPMPPGMPHHHMNMFSLKRVRHSSGVGIILAPALDADPFVSSVLLERAKALSHQAGKETVVLVAHGPVDAAAIADWERDLSIHARAIVKGGFRAAQAALLRDDAAPEVRAKAVAELRATVEAAGRDGGKALVVPVLIARGGIEDKIPRDLAGLAFAWSGDALLPHAGFDRWVLKRAQDAAAHQ